MGREIFKVVVLALLCAPADAGVPGYALTGAVPVSGAQAFDVLPDGRIVVSSGRDVLVESAPGSGSLMTWGRLPAGAISAFGASFIRVSPSGGLIALGDNNAPGVQYVHVVRSTDLSPGADAPTVAVAVPNFDAAWTADDRLYVSGAANFVTPAQVARVDLGPTPTVTSVISGVGDGSGGVCVHAGRVYVGVGYDSSDATTGHIRSFDLASLSTSTGPVSFQSGLIVGDVLSAAPIDFDGFGRLLVGGGDFGASSFDAGTVAVIDLSTGVRADLAPAGFAFYGVRYNSARAEVLVADLFGASPAIYRYSIPAPGSGVVVCFGAVSASRRRRRA